MMFSYLQNYKFILILICIEFLLRENRINSFSILNKNNKFDEIKTDFISNVEKNKLATYMKKNKLKNKSPLADNFIFLDSSTDLLILKKIKSSDLNFSSNELEKSINNVNDKDTSLNKINQKDEFKARIFSFIYKNIKTKSLKYKPIGVNVDEEKIPNWKIFLVLMDYIKDNNFDNNLFSDKKVDPKNFSDHKLLKVCFPENNEKNNFAIIVNFDKSCLEYVNFANTVNLLSDEQSEQTNHLRNYQNFLLNKNLYKNLSKEKNYNLNLSNNNKNLNFAGSFIEKSQNILENNLTSNNNSKFENNNKNQEKENGSGKAIGFNSLVSKFSVEELNKIKSLIKFAKKNKIMDHIYEKKGELNLNELVNVNNQINLQNNSGKDIPEINTLAKIGEKQVYDSKDIVTISNQINNQITYLNNFAANIDAKMLELTEMMSSVKQMSMDIKESLMNMSDTHSINFRKINHKNKSENQYKNEIDLRPEFRFKQKRTDDIEEKIEIGVHNNIISNNHNNDSFMPNSNPNYEINHLINNSNSHPITNNSFNLNQNPINSNMMIPNINNIPQTFQNQLIQQNNNLAQIPIMNNNMITQNPLNNNINNNMNNNLNQMIPNPININPNLINQQQIVSNPNQAQIILPNQNQITTNNSIINNVQNTQTLNNINNNANNNINNFSVPNVISQPNPVSLPIISNGISIGGSFNNLVNNQNNNDNNNRTNKNQNINIPSSLQNSNISSQTINNKNQQNNNNHNNHNIQKDQNELKNKNPINNNNHSSQNNQKKDNINKTNLINNNHKILSNNQNTNSNKNNNNIPSKQITNNINNNSKNNNNINRTSASRRSPPPKRPNISNNNNNNNKNLKHNKPEPKKSNSPFLSNSFDNLEDDDVMEIAASNQKALQKSKQNQKNKNSSFDFDDDP